jgi:hypothetical protein
MPPKKKGDGKGGPKPGTKQAKAVAEKADEKKQAPAEEPKKPSVKEVIGGASWTGKLPVNMLAEHCQKQKWEKPEYSMVINLFCYYSSHSAQCNKSDANISGRLADKNFRWIRFLCDNEENRPEDQRTHCDSTHEAPSLS